MWYQNRRWATASVCLPVVSPLMPCVRQDVVPEHEVGHSFRLSVCCFPFNALAYAGSDLVPEQVGHSFGRSVCLFACLSVCLSVAPHLMPCADQDLVPEQVGRSFSLSVCLSACLSVCVCYSAFNALCRSRRGTRTDGGPQLWSVCLSFCLFVCLLFRI